MDSAQVKPDGMPGRISKLTDWIQRGLLFENPPSQLETLDWNLLETILHKAAGAIEQVHYYSCI